MIMEVPVMKMITLIFASMHPPTKKNAPQKEVVALARIDVLYLLKLRVKVQVLVRQKRKEPEQSPEDPTAGTAKAEATNPQPGKEVASKPKAECNHCSVTL